MDSITQGLLGAAVSQTALGHKLGRRAGYIGFAAGVAADLDIFLRSSQDPLFGLLAHRGPSHALMFVPLGGLIIGVAAWLVLRRRVPFGLVFLAAFLAYATHGLLDAFTTYGTQLYWPFAETRVSWDWLPIVDLGFSLPLLVGLIITWRRKKTLAVALGLLLALLYTGFAGWQHHRALLVQQQIAAQRGTPVDRGRAIPTVLNTFLWRSVYESDGVLFADAVRVVPFAQPVYWAGGTVPRITAEQAKKRWQPELAKQVVRFDWFAQGYLFAHKKEKGVLGDFRYAMVPNSTSPMWGIRLPKDGTGVVQRVHYRDVEENGLTEFWSLLTGSGNSVGGLPGEVSGGPVLERVSP